MAEVVSGDAIEALARVSKEARKAIMRGVSKAAQLVVGTAARNVRARLNTTGKAKGNLWRSISFDLEDRNLRALVGPRRVVYAAIHEFGGTIRQVRGSWHTVRSVTITIPARPYLHPALVANEANIEQAIGDAVEALL